MARLTPQERAKQVIEAWKIETVHYSWTAYDELAVHITKAIQEAEEKVLQDERSGIRDAIRAGELY